MSTMVKAMTYPTSWDEADALYKSKANRAGVVNRRIKVAHETYLERNTAFSIDEAKRISDAHRSPGSLSAASGHAACASYSIVYHRTAVVTFLPENAGIRLDSGGYRTSTTKKRMNQALRRVGPKATRSVYQHRFHWYLTDGATYDVDFYDHMIVDA